MPGLQLSGLATGFDWKSVVDQLMEVSRTPIKRLQNDQKNLNTQNSALTEIRNLILQLDTSLKSLNTETFQTRSTSVSGNSSWTASASAGTSTGSYTFNVTQIATAAKQIGTSDIAKGISPTNSVSSLVLSNINTAQPVTAGFFTVNGQQITIATTDTLQDVFDKISTQTGGAVTASYNASTDRVTLTSSSTITLGSSADTSNFLTVFKLFNNGSNTITSSDKLGTAKTNVPLTQAGFNTSITNDDGSGNSSFKINGVTINYNINTDSIQSVISKINNSSAGVTASYDPVADRFILTNKNTGNLGLTIEESGTGFLAASGLSSGTFQAGTNAVFTVNGGSSIISTSNKLDASSHGITGLSVTVDSTGTNTVTVTNNTSDVKSKIEDIIAKYNAVQSAIDKYTNVTVSNNKVTSGPLAGNSNINEISSKLRSFMFNSLTGISGSIKKLDDLGIDFSGTSSSSLTVKNPSKLQSALTNSLNDVSNFFLDQTNGFVKKLTDYISNITNTGGSLYTQIDSINKQNKDINQQIETIERQLEFQRKMLENSFIQMEQASSYYQKQGQMLNSAIVQFRNSR
ncbi:MAG: flagellar filament capping protein FliD [Chthoniobacterales bacterium]|nr:flagellar filament capping protein FliD [Chthoniobacterales bacterium]